MTETRTGSSRSAGITYQELLDADTHPLRDQRTVRDVNVLCSHMALNEDLLQENLGRILLGLDSNAALL